MSKFPFYKQLDGMDCGPTCLRMIANIMAKHSPCNNSANNPTYSVPG